MNTRDPRFRNAKRQYTKKDRDVAILFLSDPNGLLSNDEKADILNMPFASIQYRQQKIGLTSAGAEKAAWRVIEQTNKGPI